jgi:hypothetical protein
MKRPDGYVNMHGCPSESKIILNRTAKTIRNSLLWGVGLSLYFYGRLATGI